jgi:hypothetical protein
MQDHRDAQGCLKPAPSKRLQRCPRAAKEQTKHHSGSESAKRAQLGGHRKDDVKVRNIEQSLTLLLNPPLLRERLALRTMPIAA